MQPASEKREAALDDSTLGLARRGLWVICIAIYLGVFVGGLQAGGAELGAMGRAAAFTVAAAVLGRILLGLLGRASLPVEEGPLTEEPSPIGSLVDLVGSTNVAQQEDKAEAA